jgi:hypothetical protein
VPVDELRGHGARHDRECSTPPHPAEGVPAFHPGRLAVPHGLAQYPDSTLADLYDPLTMPPALAKAHTAVDRLYRRAAFASNAERVALLFERYQALTAVP